MLDIISDGYKIPFITTPPPCKFRNNASARKDSDFVTEAVLGLLHDKCVEELDAAPEIINPLSVSVQNTGKKRLILDLRHINLHVFKKKIKCEGLHTIKDIFSRNCFVFSFNLKSGYHHVISLLSIASIWHSCGTWVRGMQDIFSSPSFHSAFLAPLSNPLEIAWDSNCNFL